MIDFSQVVDIMLGNTPVTQIEDSHGNTLWSSAPVTPTNYFYVEDISGNSNTLSITNKYGEHTIEVFKSTDQTNWTSMGSTSDTPITATIPANGKLYLKATTNGWSDNDNFDYNYIRVSGLHNIGGNIMSLLYGDNFENRTTFPSGSRYNFSYLFGGNTNLISASNLDLHATTLTDYCYDSMFMGCTSLTTAPALPVTTLAYSCYSMMFYGCISLTTAPVLSATTLASNCYNNMFYGCRSLTTPPTLPATTLAQYCYAHMFENCIGLTTAPVLNATTLVDYCYVNMFYGCESLTTAPALPATTLAAGCYQNMFFDCTSLTTAPALPATTLAVNCYSYMFYGCRSLTTAPATLPATTLATNCYQNMFFDCRSLTTAPAVLPATTLADYCYRNMFYRCESLTTAPALPATTLAQECYSYMFYGCTALTTAPATLPATTLTVQCYQYMFDGCISLTTAPVLPATTLAANCYNHMFYACSSLNSVTTYAQDISASQCTYNWLFGVAYTGNFYNEGGAPYQINNSNGVPSGWTEHLPAAPNYFYIKNTSNDDVNVYIRLNGSSPSFTIYYSTDGFRWFNLGSYYLYLEPDQKLYLRATTNKWATNTSDYINIDVLDSLTGNDIEFNVGGNIMSLLYGENFENTTFTSSNSYAFCNLFNGSKVEDASDLDLPSNTTVNCYRNMFSNCTSLIAAPVLPATTVVLSCYNSMFYGCSSLEEIVTYNTTYSSGAFNNWLYDVAPSGDLYNLGSASFPLNDPSGIPSGWTEHYSL